jgi:hypothetical protein
VEDSSFCGEPALMEEDSLLVTKYMKKPNLTDGDSHTVGWQCVVDSCGDSSLGGNLKRYFRAWEFPHPIFPPTHPPPPAVDEKCIPKLIAKLSLQFSPTIMGFFPQNSSTLPFVPSPSSLFPVPTIFFPFPIVLPTLHPTFLHFSSHIFSSLFPTFFPFPGPTS